MYFIGNIKQHLFFMLIHLYIILVTIKNIARNVAARGRKISTSIVKCIYVCIYYIDTEQSVWNNIFNIHSNNQISLKINKIKPSRLYTYRVEWVCPLLICVCMPTTDLKVKYLTLSLKDYKPTYIPTYFFFIFFCIEFGCFTYQTLIIMYNVPTL